ncbi:hypothetical protein PENVUL_c048G07399 [Penicillium vulpinum]|uniref:Uncharacterized protein n=2 Tax=Penicillium vulpinum TaxID=29845 RepID=A0A1V6RGG4_9EURO|nr:hypothetical protein PENVUL_c048G07399 [Penicillium vulpinum]
MKTDITLPPKSSPYTTGAKQTRNLDHILNPTAYYEKLDTLELDTAQICGLNGGPPDANSQRDFRDGFRKVNSALKNLQTEGFCGRMMSILIEDPVQPDIARAVHICPEDLDGSGISHSTRADEILQEICGDEVLLRDFQPGPDDSRYCFLATALLVGLVSFSGSHVCSFDVNLWRRSVIEIPVGFEFSFRRRDLACLRDFVGGPAWVLGRQSVKSNGTGVKVSLTVQDLQELWGPVWLVGGTRENGPIIRTERGFVVPLPPDQQSDMTGREVECHWTTAYPQYADVPNPIMLNNTSRVLIGTTFGLNINSECQNQISDIQNHFANQLQLPGACNHYYITEGYDVQLIGGQYVTGGIVGKRKRIPATTLKAALISEILDPELDVTPLLKMNIGLEISACTGNARRLSLWHTLYLSQKRQGPHKPADCKHDIGSIDCIQQCWKQSRLNRSTVGVRCFDCGVSNTTAALPTAPNFKNDISSNDIARSRIVSAIMALQHTGLDPEGNLQAYWPFVETRMTRRVQPNRSNKWFNIIADTRDSATFAVASYNCLEFQEELSLSCCLNGYRDPSQKTCLSIRVAQQPVVVTERRFRQNLGLLTPPPESDLAGLLPGASFYVAGTQCYVKKIRYGQQSSIIACINSTISQIMKRPGLPTFLEHLNPEVGKPVEVVIYKK